MVIKIATYRGNNKVMEDNHIVFVGNNFSIYAIFDGHNGDYCSKKAAVACRRYVDNWKSTVEFDHLKSLIHHLYSIFEDDRYAEWCGTTALIVIQTKNYMYVANIGDSIFCLFDGNLLKFMTKRHRLNTNDEKKILINLGYQITDQRVNGVLQPSRCLGDHHVFFKNRPPADLYSLHVKGIKNPRFLLASDGVWDYIDHKEINNQIFESPSNLHTRLVESAIDNGSRDNLTTIIVY